MAIDSTQATPSGLDVWPPVVASGGGGSVDTMTATASENLAAGALCNIWNNGGVFNVRNADASKGAGYEAHGWTDASVTSGNAATVRFLGVNTHSSGLTPGPVFLGNVGAATSTAPTTAGYLSQEVGSAESATSFSFEWHPDILLATPTTQTYGGTLQSQYFGSSGTWTPPDGVTGCWVSGSGAGGGGSTMAGGTQGGGGGGSGEECVMQPVTVSGPVAVGIGAGGAGAPAASGSAAGSDGGATTFGGFLTLLGGHGGTTNAGDGGAGGGPLGGAGGVAGSSSAGATGNPESPTYFGGTGGGGGSSGGLGTKGGAYGGFAQGAAGGAASGGQGGGGGGGTSSRGLGGVGGTGGTAGTSATNPGSGGGGAGALTGSTAAGGKGADGWLAVFWVS